MLQQLRERFSFIEIVMWVLRIVVIVVVLWGSFVSITSGTYSLAQWQDLIIVGLAQGGVYALLALGYTMVYGILGFINFAHCVIFMGGAMHGFYVAYAPAKNGPLA